MKKYIWLILVIVVFGVFSIRELIKKVNDDTVVDSDRHAVGEKVFKPEELLVIGDAPEFEFTDQNGDVISNADYKGQVYVVEFFFTNCPTICPVMNRNMIKLQNEFKEHEDFGIASFTIDPVNDTPEVLKQYAENYGVTNPNWHFMTGDIKKIMALSNTGFNLYAGVNANVDGGFEHSGLFAMIDRNGKIRSRVDEFGNPVVYYDGTSDEGVEAIKRDLKTLLNN